MLPEVMGALFGKKEAYLEAIARTASRINARNASVYWDSARNVEILSSFLARQRDVEGAGRPELQDWLQRFAEDPQEAPSATGTRSTGAFTRR